MTLFRFASSIQTQLQNPVLLSGWEKKRCVRGVDNCDIVRWNTMNENDNKQWNPRDIIQMNKLVACENKSNLTM